ncbi:hypothetical protein GOV09_03385 [Candidatus Woesearchaeota archaeon]|nr:hypothetical protein [Candidatus Woesearchaeota archaeon]
MIPVDQALGLVAPYYNLTLVVIVIALFVALFRYKETKTFMLPWRLLFNAVLIYVFEQVLAVLDIMGIIPVPRIFFGIFEFAIITIFIYLLLVQQQYIAKNA